MSILVDSNVLAAPRIPKDLRRSRAAAALQSALRGTWGGCVVTDYILDEAVTLVLSRAQSHPLADDLAALLLGEAPHRRQFVLIPVGHATFAEARRLFRELDDQGLSFTDCTSIAAMREHGLDAILSFDQGFDGIVHRIDPADEASLAAAP